MKKCGFTPDYRLYDKYYSQAGGALPYFRGSLIQEGYGGLGGLIGRLITKTIIPLATKGLMKHAVPMLKRGAKALGKHALKTGAEALIDVASKKRSGKEAISHGASKIRKHAPEIIKSELMMNQEVTKKKKKKKRNRKTTDIFSK